MNKKFIIIILLICGCFYRNQKINSNSQEFTFKVVSYNAIPSDSLESNIFIKIPLKPLVFRKTEGYFESNLEISIKIKDSISESQISRFSWHEKIIEEFYNPTRSNESTYQIHKKIMLKGGQYEFIVNIKDLDSHRKWKIDKDILVCSNNNISDLILFSMSFQSWMSICLSPSPIVSLNLPFSNWLASKPILFSVSLR